MIMEYFRIAIRPMLITFAGMATIFVAMNAGRGEEPPPSTAASKAPVVAAKQAVKPEDVTSITLTHRDGPGIRVQGAIVLIRTHKNSNYFHRLAKAIIDNRFFELNKNYFGGFDGPGIEIKVKYGNREKVVVNYDYRTLTDPTYLFEMLILGADADMKTQLRPENN